MTSVVVSVRLFVAQCSVRIQVQQLTLHRYHGVGFVAWLGFLEFVVIFIDVFSPHVDGRHIVDIRVTARVIRRSHIGVAVH